MAEFKPFTVWNVSEDEDYKLVLEAQGIVELEDKFGGSNLMSAIGNTATGMPSLKTMMTVTHAAMHRYNHGIKMSEVYAIFDRYVSNGGSQVNFYTDVYVPIFQVSGFFPREQTDEMSAKLDELKN